MTDLPKKVRVGPFVWQIRGWTKDEADIDTEAYGQCHPDKLLICLRDTCPHSVVASTLLHEILHAIWSTYSISHAGGNEERSVSALEVGLATVIKDNPKVFSYITEGLRT